LSFPAGPSLLFSETFDDPFCPADLPPDALGSARGAAYRATLFAESLPSRTSYRACYSATGPPRFARSATTCSSCTPLCPSCLLLFAGHVSSLTVNDFTWFRMRVVCAIRRPKMGEEELKTKTLQLKGFGENERSFCDRMNDRAQHFGVTPIPSGESAAQVWTFTRESKRMVEVRVSS